jgi:hypothetical protein
MRPDEVIEHGETPAERRLRSQRLRVALAVALLEGVVVIADWMPWWVAVLLAIVAVAAHLAFGRTDRRSLVRSISWIAAVSQLLVVVVPALLAVAVALAIVVLVLAAIALLVVLLLDRR